MRIEERKAIRIIMANKPQAAASPPVEEVKPTSLFGKA